MRIDRARDRYIGACARQQFTAATLKKYGDVLDPFVDMLIGELGPDATVGEVTRDHCEAYLDRYGHQAPATVYLYTTVVQKFFEYCRVDQEWIERSPAEKLKRPKRIPVEDLEVVHVDEDQVGLLFAACQAVDEFLCLSILAYLGVRRTAAANLRWRDLDLDKGSARFREKGGKVIVKPIPLELADLLYKIALSGDVPNAPDDYVIPNRVRGRDNFTGGRQVVRFQANKRARRSNKVVYNAVKRVAERAGVDAHPHALRAAFAVHYLKANPGDLDALQYLLGHSRVETTRTYLRRQDKFEAMGRVRPLSWSGVLQPFKGLPPAGFEPALQAEALPKPIGQKLDDLLAETRLRQSGRTGDRRR